MKADEDRLSLYLENFELITKRFTKTEMRASKTPDFRVVRDGELIFFCEVKSSPPDRWLDEQLEAAPDEIAGGLRSDPIFNRLSTDIHTAVKQLDAVNSDQMYPNVLALVNHDDMCGFNDLLGVLTGNFYGDDGSKYPIYQQFAQGRIKDEKHRIHLFIWLDDHKLDRLLFSQTNDAHHSTLCTAFGIEQAKIRQIDA